MSGLGLSVGFGEGLGHLRFQVFGAYLGFRAEECRHQAPRHHR